MKSKVILFIVALILFLPAVNACGPRMPLIGKDVIYCNHDGVSLLMDVFRPEDMDILVPAIIYVHGGGWYSGDKTTGTGREDIPYLVDRGFLVAAINYRLAPRYKFPAQIEDVKCAVRFLRANADQFGLDPARIGVMGESAGGHLAALLGVIDENCGFDCDCDCIGESSRVQAVVNMFGPVNLKLMFERDKSMLMEHVFGVYDPQSQIIQNASPVTHVSCEAAPFLIIHGEKDEQILIDQSKELYASLVSSNIPASLITVENAGHGFIPVDGQISPTRPELTRMIGDFFTLHLK